MVNHAKEPMKKYLALAACIIGTSAFTVLGFWLVIFSQVTDVPGWKAVYAILAALSFLVSIYISGIGSSIWKKDAEE